MNKSLTRFQLLLVEDNRGDIDLIREALKSVSFAVAIETVADGEEALHYLRRQGKYSQSPRPNLVLLDLNLPKKDGREVLAEVKGDPGLRSIPVVVLTSSEAGDDVATSYQLGANCYITKPFSLDDFLQRICEVTRFWMETATLPT